MNGNTNKKKVKCLKLSDEHPLRGVITCPFCERKFTSRNTRKYCVKNGNKECKTYPYYGCNNKRCTNRLNLPKKQLEAEFEKTLEIMKSPPGISGLLHAIVDEHMKKEKSKEKEVKGTKQNIINRYKFRQQELEKIILKTSNEKLYEKFEEERSSLDSKIDNINSELKQEINYEEKVKKIQVQMDYLLNDPIKLRENSNPKLKKLLVSIQFGDSLIYTKKSGLQTSSDRNLFSITGEIHSRFPLIGERGQKIKPDFSTLIAKYCHYLVSVESTMIAVWDYLDYLGLIDHADYLRLYGSPFPD